MAELANWDSFYLIVGAAPGALIGLQFVVMTIIASRAVRGVADANTAFATPNIVHFSIVLLLSALLRAPWPTVTAVAVSWGLVGLIGSVYAIVVTRRIRVQTIYQPEFEDWLFHALLPLAAYIMLILSAVAAIWFTREALFGVGATALLLLFVGIHNAWDAVAFLVSGSRSEE